MNTLFYGDNLNILKDYIDSETIDLVYLDPPFQSGRDYNIIYKPVKGATAQIKTFEDTWNWGGEAENEYSGLISGSLTREQPTQKLIDLMKAMRSYLNGCPLMAYLCMMAPRLLELKRVLKSTGSIYLHCDPTASHYLKLLLDGVFGFACFKNEFIWCYTERESSKKHWNKKHDVLLYYTKSTCDSHTFNWKEVTHEYSEGTEKKFNYTDENGKKFQIRGKSTGNYPKMQGLSIDLETTDPESVYRDYFDKSPGTPPRDWIHIPVINRSAKERMGYPTQKPEALLERIIRASSNPGDTVLDPFCGCGTAVAVAERLNRKWLGIDITYLSIDVIKKRFISNKILEGEAFQVKGVPTDALSAGALFQQDHFQFEVWAVSQLNAMPTTKTGDKGVDGVINFFDVNRSDQVGKGIISVKGGEFVNPGMVRDLKGTLESQDAAFGILITRVEPTKGMKEEAVKAGDYFYHGLKGSIPIKIPKIQLITVDHLFMSPIPVKLPPEIYEPYRKPSINKFKQDQTEIDIKM